MAHCVHCQADTERYENEVPICLSCAYDRTTIAPKPPAAVVSPESNLRDALFRDLAAATKRVSVASTALDEIIGQFKRDDTQRMQNASEELEAARKEMARAHNRLNDFLSHGIIPADLNRAVGI